MFGIGAFSWIAGALQLVVPSYALRLVRRYGTHRVGWFVVAAFLALALMHLLLPPRLFGARPAPGMLLDFVYLAGSVLLLVGLGHVETMFWERERARWTEDNLRRSLRSRVEEETAELRRVNEELTQEIARRDQIQAAQEQSESQYRSLFTENPLPMWILERESCTFLAVNKAALAQYGFGAQEFMSLNGRDLMLPSEVSGFLQDVARPCNGAESRGIQKHCKKDGTLIDVEITAVDLVYRDVPARLFLAQDVTERRRREMELRKIHRVETIGNVAGGVGHHFDNIMTIIEGYTTELLDKPVDLKSAEYLQHICAAVGRGSSLTRQLLTAGGRQQVQPEAIDLNRLIKNEGPMLRRLIGTEIELNIDCSAAVPYLLGDRHLVEHILVNLVENARDAMPNGGTLTVGTATIDVDDAQVESGHPGKSGDFVRLSVQDTGCGMTPQVQSRLFEPFFTTKESEETLGMGLASVYGAVRQQSGWVEFTTEVGVGTEFRVFLPRAPLPMVSESEIPSDIELRGTVMLVEADDRVRALAHFVLNRHGYRVIEADCAATALLLWAGQAATVDLLLTDVHLPGDLSGFDLVDRLRQTRPGLKVAYTSNQSVESAEHYSALLPGFKLISKPYSPDDLVQAVQESLKS